MLPLNPLVVCEGITPGLLRLQRWGVAQIEALAKCFAAQRAVLAYHLWSLRCGQHYVAGLCSNFY